LISRAILATAGLLHRRLFDGGLTFERRQRRSRGWWLSRKHDITTGGITMLAAAPRRIEAVVVLNARQHGPRSVGAAL
jgi:hypothetical protein